MRLRQWRRQLQCYCLCRLRYIDDSNPEHSFPVYSEADIDYMALEVRSQRAGARAWFSDLDRFKLGWAAMKHVDAAASLQSLSIAVVGSQRPRFEAILLALGARHVTVIEYAPATLFSYNFTSVLTSLGTTLCIGTTRRYQLSQMQNGSTVNRVHVMPLPSVRSLPRRHAAADVRSRGFHI